MGEDKAIYKKVKCCHHNSECEKKLAVEAAEKKVEELEGTIEQLTALSAELSNKLKELNDELQKDTEELAEAITLRQKQLAEFHGGEVDSIQAIENLKEAIVALGQHHDGALYQIHRFEFKLRHDVESFILNTMSVNFVSNNVNKNPK